MISKIDMEIGQWYKSFESQAFEIVAIDESDKTIEIQYYDGTISELDFNAWAEHMPYRIAPPEDSYGPFELELDDKIFSTDDSTFSSTKSYITTF